jgi:hypothetical protein
VIERVATWLSTKLADPKVITDIRSLGQSLAGAFDKAVTFAQNIPWGSIKDAMTLMGKGAKWALDAFTAMPSWVQTAVVTGWGLNKLTGGALGSIVAQLGSGLIKGVLGMTAGIVNINAGVVNGGIAAAGAEAPVAAAAGGGWLTGILGIVAKAAVFPAVALALREILPGAKGTPVGREIPGQAPIAGQVLPNAFNAAFVDQIDKSLGKDSHDQAVRDHAAQERLDDIAANTAVMAKHWTTALTPAVIAARSTKAGGPTESAVSATLLKDAATRLASGQRDLRVGMVDLIHAIHTWKPPVSSVYVTVNTSIRDGQIKTTKRVAVGASPRPLSGAHAT